MSVLSLWQVSSYFHSLLSSPDGRYFCSIEHKSNQKCPLSLRSERTKNHRHNFCFYLYTLPFLLTFAVCFGRYLSVIFRFLLSASRVLFPAHLYLKHLPIQLTATLLLSHSLFSSSSLRVLYPLPTLYPTVDSRLW